jgi:hypothetical protein
LRRRVGEALPASPRAGSVDAGAAALGGGDSTVFYVASGGHECWPMPSATWVAGAANVGRGGRGPPSAATPDLGRSLPPTVEVGVPRPDLLDSAGRMVVGD